MMNVLNASQCKGRHPLQKQEQRELLTSLPGKFWALHGTCNTLAQSRRWARVKWARIPHWALLSVMTLALDGVVIYEVLKKLLVFSQTNNVSFFPGGSDGKESACKAGDVDSIIGLGRSPEEGHGNPLQHSWLQNSMARGASQSTVHGVSEWDMTEQLTLSLS